MYTLDDIVLISAGHSRTQAVELPTSFNDDAAPSPEIGLPVGYTSPVSPEIPVEKDGNTPENPSRPGHQRNVSSMSSMWS